MKTGQDFRDAVELNNLTQWHIHNCSICGYDCGYRFISGEVYYDNGCYCTCGENLNKRTWGDVANQYLIQTNPEVINGMNKMFNFKD